MDSARVRARLSPEALKEEEEERGGASAPTLRINRRERDSKMPPVGRGGMNVASGGVRGEGRHGDGKGRVEVKLIKTSDFDPSDWSPADSGVYSRNP